MIFTECTECGRSLAMGLVRSIAGTDRYAPLACDDCGTRVVVEQTRMDGRTYGEEHFVESVLPEKGVERIDVPDMDEGMYVYADPEEIHVTPPGQRDTDNSKENDQ